MKKVLSVLVLVVLIGISSCEDKESEVFENTSNSINPDRSADQGQNGGDPHSEGPG